MIVLKEDQKRFFLQLFIYIYFYKLIFKVKFLGKIFDDEIT